MLPRYEALLRDFVPQNGDSKYNSVNAFVNKDLFRSAAVHHSQCCAKYCFPLLRLERVNLPIFVVFREENIEVRIPGRNFDHHYYWDLVSLEKNFNLDSALLDNLVEIDPEPSEEFREPL